MIFKSKLRTNEFADYGRVRVQFSHVTRCVKSVHLMAVFILNRDNDYARNQRKSVTTSALFVYFGGSRFNFSILFI